MGSHRVEHDWSDLAAAAADSILKSRDITLSTKVHLVKVMVFPVVMYGCESWTIKKAESEVTQLYLTLCDAMDCSLPGSSIHGIFQARVLEWVAISFSSAWKWKAKVKLLSRVRLFTTPWTAAHQTPPSVEFSRQEYWSGVPSPSLPILFKLVLFEFSIIWNWT